MGTLFLEFENEFSYKHTHLIILSGMNSKENGTGAFSGFPQDGNFDIQNKLKSVKRTYLDIGTVLGKYEIIEEIDRGGMAVVYKAIQKDLNRVVALKVLPANITINDNFVNRFLSEAKSVAKLQHPNIVNIYEVSVERHIYFLAMEYLPGKNLFYYLNQDRPKLVDVLEILRKLAIALDYAHRKKILHRDLKLNNVIMKNNEEPVLIDFGLAKVIGEGSSSGLTRTGEIAGSPAYMAPERIFNRNVDERSDICSLGIMLYEMLTFKNPYLDPRSMVQTTKNVVEANPVPPTKLVHWLPIEVESITLKSMSADPAERYQTMKDFADDIKRYQEGEEVLASPPSLLSKIRRYMKKYWAQIVISSLVVMFVLIIAFIFGYQSSKEVSRWQLAVSEDFSNKDEISKNWIVYTGNKGKEVGTWSILDSALYVESNGFTYLKMKKKFPRDIKVEFDVTAGMQDLFNVGFFFYGESPNMGYSANIHTGPDVLSGITLPNSDFLFYDYSPANFLCDSTYHVTFECKNNVIVFTLNNTEVARIADVSAIHDSRHQRIGFFVNGSSAYFDNFKLYRRSFPRLAKPTLIADRFFVEGDYEAALSEYEEVLQDLSGSSISTGIKFKIVDCLVRLKRNMEAVKYLKSIEYLKKLSEDEIARVLYFKGRIASDTIKDYRNNLNYVKLATEFPYSTENISNAVNSINTFDKEIGISNFNKHLNDYDYLSKLYPQFADKFGRVALELQHKCAMKNYSRKTLVLGRAIVNNNKNNEEITISAKINNSLIYLNNRNINKAVNILTECISTPGESIAKWKAWYLLAESYEYDKKYSDAYLIYKKIFDESSKRHTIAWLSRIRMAELSNYINIDENPKEILRFVVNEPHVFMEPRIIAQYYSNMITWKYLRKELMLIYSDPGRYKYYVAMRQLMSDKATRLSSKYYRPPRVGENWNDIRLGNVVRKLKKKQQARYLRK